jgi:hypothetical protein
MIRMWGMMEMHYDEDVTGCVTMRIMNDGDVLLREILYNGEVA